MEMIYIYIYIYIDIVALYVPRGMEPALKDAVSEIAVVPTAARPTPELRADSPGVVVPPGVPAAGLLTGVGEGAVSPVVAAATGAPPHLELVHAEVVRRVRVRVGVV